MHEWQVVMTAGIIGGWVSGWYSHYLWTRFFK